MTQTRRSPASDALATLSTAEKVDLVTGQGMWRTRGIERIGLDPLVMTDGTHGVRYSITQIDNEQEAGQDFAAFLTTVNRKANQAEVAWGEMRPATCFPNGSSVACSWDTGLIYEMGAALGRECRAYGVDILLGPGINIRRTPFAGRAYEYFSEDPLLTGDLAAGMINGLQDQGVGSSLKHFACNNSEIERTTMDSVVEMRALREIYLFGFERAIAKSDPWTLMTSYNRLNGEQAAQSRWLLDDVLRGEWGYEGVVMSDWHGIKDRPASVLAGNDLDMPESRSRRDALLAAIESGAVPMEALDRSCARLLRLAERSVAASTIEMPPLDPTAHHALARRIASESLVLLRNEGGVLPLASAALSSIAVIGQGATEPVIQGSGCATTAPTRVDIPLDCIRAIASDARVEHFAGMGCAQACSDAIDGARSADVAIVFANTEVGWDGEGSDRQTLALAEGQDELIAAVAAANPATIVVVSSPDAVAMPWIDAVPAVLATFFSGQAMGRAVADALFGRINPSGKTTTSFPLATRDIPGFLTYPGEQGRHVYAEGIFVGYRGYDTLQRDVLFPFGHGLGYAPFAYSDLHLDKSSIAIGETVAIAFTLANTGTCEGSEVSQIYVRYGKPRLHRPVHELKAFVKTSVPAGSSRRVEVSVSAEDLRYFDPARNAWVLDEDDLVIEVAASSRDVRLEAPIVTRSEVGRYRIIERDTQTQIVLDTPIARAGFRDFLADRLSVSPDEADRMLMHCASSFFGIVTTLELRFRLHFDTVEIDRLVEVINAAILQAEVRA